MCYSQFPDQALCFLALDFIQIAIILSLTNILTDPLNIGKNVVFPIIAQISERTCTKYISPFRP